MGRTRRTNRVESRSIIDMRKEIGTQSRSLGKNSDEVGRSRGKDDSRKIGKDS